MTNLLRMIRRWLRLDEPIRSMLVEDVTWETLFGYEEIYYDPWLEVNL